jgi:hypothetical protein
MTDERREPEDEVAVDRPLDAQLMSLVRDAIEVDAAAIPREMMWARLQHQRRQRTALDGADAIPPAPTATDSAPVLRFREEEPARVVSRGRSWGLRAVGIAALLVAGVGVGRYLLPASGASRYQLAVQAATDRADSVAALGFGPEALAALPVSTEPARVAMDEHLARTVALLTALRDEDPALGPSPDVSGWARELLGTTRLLIDEPQLHDERTRRLLQDLELVLAQIIQVRRSAPETQRAPNETMRETNLLPRMRAAVTASRFGDETTLGGGL